MQDDQQKIYIQKLYKKSTFFFYFPFLFCFLLFLSEKFRGFLFVMGIDKAKQEMFLVKLWSLFLLFFFTILVDSSKANKPSCELTDVK